MSRFDTAFFTGLGTLMTGFGLEALMNHAAKTQSLAETYLARVDRMNAETVQQAYRFAEQAFGVSPRLGYLGAIAAGGVLFGRAVYDLAKSYERKE